MSDRPTTLAWVKPYYTRAGEYWGPTGVQVQHEARLSTLHRLCGPEPKRVLELGAGTGEAAALMAYAGHDVVAVEFSPTRAPSVRLLAETPGKGRLTAVEADFYTVDLKSNFDVVCYWDGFGVGSDEDQRRLLKRIASEWLTPKGSLLVDVFSPNRWILGTGKEWWLDRNHPSHRFKQRRTFDFDPIEGCFPDTWCPIDDETGEPDESMAITQRIRCYNPSDLSLLLEGTGLTLKRLEINGQELNKEELWSAWSYLAQLTPDL